MKTLALLSAMLLAIAVVATAQQTDPSGPQRDSTAPDGTQHRAMMMTGDMHKDMQMMNKMMVARLGESDGGYDARLIDMLIPHHEGAIVMAKDALKKSRRPEIQALAKKMIEAQQKEIKQLQEWKKAWYGQAADVDRAADSAER